MRHTLLMTCVLLAGSLSAHADVIEMPPPAATAAPVQLPAKGIRMATVQKQYGAPLRKHAAVGGDTRKHPPITRWDYAGFSVFFERGRVIDAVIPEQPAPVHNAEQLKSP